MSVSDPIADMLTILRNASRIKKDRVDVPYSRMTEGILDILKKKGYLRDFKRMEDNQRLIRVYLKFFRSQRPAITQLRRISKPGRRVYAGWEKIPLVLGGKGAAVISTSKGLLTDEDARAGKVGGEIICKVW